MAAVLGSPEFASRSERFKAITAINVSVRADPQANTVLVTNQSLFALENVKMDWQYTLVENKPAPAPTPAQPRRSARPTASPLLLQKYDVVETVYRLEPGKTYALFTDRATKGTITTTDTIDARKLTVPKATVTVTSSSIGATTVEVPH
jgi:hypothetical protein